MQLARLLLASIILLLGVHAARAASFEENVQLLLKLPEIKDLGRYMEPEKGCKPTTFEGWEDFKPQRCEYPATHAENTTLVVIMLNPDRPRLARWVVSACDAAGLANARCWSHLWTHIRLQSGSQFAIAGLVDESYVGGICTGICFIAFRDGVAAQLNALDNFAKQDRAGMRSLNKFDIKNRKHVDWVLSAAFTNPGDQSRIASTTLEELKNWLGKNPSDAPPQEMKRVFPGLIRYYYQRAWKADNNVLITAWAWSHRDCLATEKGC